MDVDLIWYSKKVNKEELLNIKPNNFAISTIDDDGDAYIIWPTDELAKRDIFAHPNNWNFEYAYIDFDWSSGYGPSLITDNMKGKLIESIWYDGQYGAYVWNECFEESANYFFVGDPNTIEAITDEEKETLDYFINIRLPNDVKEREEKEERERKLREETNKLCDEAMELLRRLEAKGI